MFARLKEKRRIRDAADGMYRTVVAQARMPIFYASHEVPDTPDGRFDLILLHAYVVLRRLRGGDAEQKRLSQRFFDLIFEDMDQNLREMGVGDLRVGLRVKEMAQLFYGRIRAYDECLLVDDSGLERALARNLYRDEGTPDNHLTAMSAYLRREVVNAQAWDMAEMLAGRIEFGPPPPAGAEGRSE